MDVNQVLRDTENSLRDFLALFLSSKFPADWESRLGVSPDRIAKWKERQEIEKKRQETGVVEERLLYYADFYDLPVIVKKHWQNGLSEVFGDWKTFEVLFGEMGKLRDADAHRRELLPHQKHLVLGVAGEIRGMIIRYRSKLETSEDYFPRIESVRNSVGQLWVPGQPIVYDKKMTLRVCDTVDFVVTASDPMGAELEYYHKWDGKRSSWNKENHFSITVAQAGLFQELHIQVRSSREPRAHGEYDDHAVFVFDVLPRKMGKSS